MMRSGGVGGGQRLRNWNAEEAERLIPRGTIHLQMPRQSPRQASRR